MPSRIEQTRWLEDVKRLKVLADLGLLYHTNEYDKERYQELLEISFRMLERLSSSPPEELKASFAPVTEYPTPKVDIRALVLSEEGKILMVREAADGKWALPGGWAEIGYSPAEVAVKEVREETGLQVEVQRLLAVFDKKMHPHPPELHYVYKLVFLCIPLSANLSKGFDVLDVGYFALDALPDLSEDRNVKGQIELVYQKALTNDLTAAFD